MSHVQEEKDQFPVIAKLQTLSQRNRTFSININLQHLLNVLSADETEHEPLLNTGEREQNLDLKKGTISHSLFFPLDKGAL